MVHEFGAMLNVSSIYEPCSTGETERATTEIVIKEQKEIFLDIASWTTTKIFRVPFKIPWSLSRSTDALKRAVTLKISRWNLYLISLRHPTMNTNALLQRCASTREVAWQIEQIERIKSRIVLLKWNKQFVWKKVWRHKNPWK